MADSKPDVRESKSVVLVTSKSRSGHTLDKNKSIVFGSRSNLKSRSKLRSKVGLVAESTITVNDTNDPSYTNLVLPYRVICRHRYHKSGVLQRLQFIREIKAHELLQIKALDGVRIHRIFCNTVLSPLKAEDIVKPTTEQQMKIEEILKTSLKL